MTTHELVKHYSYLREELKGTTITSNDQVELEHKMVEEGITRFRKQFETAAEKGTLSKVPVGMALMQVAMAKTIEGIEEWMETPDYLTYGVKDVRSDVLAYMTLTAVIDGIALRRTFTTVSRELGDSIRTELRLQYWLEDNNKVAKNIIKRANKKATKRHKANGLIFKMNKDGVREIDWSPDNKVRIGSRLISILIEKTGIVKLVRDGTRNKNKADAAYKLVADDETKEWIADANTKLELRSPKRMPFICRPKDWNAIDSGFSYSTAMEPAFLINRIHK